jgi:hypothetical protein
MADLKMLIKTIGGSTAYGLNTPTSDLDYRGVFINTEPAKILGLDRMDHMQKQETDDIVYYEARKFFDLLRQGNTGALEILFTDDPRHIVEQSDAFNIVRANRNRFVDVDKMFRCLLGYMQGERRLANGERTGQLGGKRKAALEQYGFSPKNFVQLLRLAECGVALFQTGTFPVNIMKYDKMFGEQLLDIKVNPWNYTKEGLNASADRAEEELKGAYESRKFFYTFDEDFANEVLRQMYLPYLTK